jgi:ribosomal protein S18 acetylase RimI-like enzyme
MINAINDSSFVVKNYSESLIREHIDDLIKIDRDAFEKYSPPYDLWYLNNFIYKLPDKDKLSFLLYDKSKDKVIGFIISSSYADATHLNRIAVSESYRGKSLGKVLVDKFLEESKKLGFKITTLSTLNDPEHDYVIRFYEKMGYRLLKEQKEIKHFLEKKNKPQDLDLFYPPNEAGKLLVMEKDL